MSAAERAGPLPAADQPGAGAPLVTPKDGLLAGKWLLAWLLALVVPARAWDPLAARAVGVAGRLLGQGGIEAVLGRFLAGRCGSAERAALAGRWAAQHRVDQLGVMRCYTPWPWRPVLEVAGLEHVAAARAAGRGCLLWVVPTAFASVVGKRALAERGLAVHHLSREGHGAVSRSRLGRRYLTLPRRRLEDRYLAERIRIPGRGVTRAAMRRLLELLRRGEIVSITLGANAERTHRTRFLDGAIVVSLGVPELARQSGAMLLPLVTLRRRHDRFSTIIEPPLDLREGGDRDGAGRAAVDELARRLEPYALAAPEQINWDYDLFEAGRRSP